mmetsp:Transcript_100912/g.159572  ORF Transcript_100912/g.159572 Transcript_100912/m.159572 type:complete len:128 (+) Transcript_100912:64-447(+)
MLASGIRDVSACDDKKMEKLVRKHVNDLKKAQVSSRYHAAEALATLGPDALQARSELERTLRSDRNALVRKSVALALGLIGCVESTEALEEAAQHDEDGFVRERAEQALRNIVNKVPRQFQPHQCAL